MPIPMWLPFGAVLGLLVFNVITERAALIAALAIVTAFSLMPWTIDPRVIKATPPGRS